MTMRKIMTIITIMIIDNGKRELVRNDNTIYVDNNNDNDN